MSLSNTVYIARARVAPIQTIYVRRGRNNNMQIRTDDRYFLSFFFSHVYVFFLVFLHLGMYFLYTRIYSLRYYRRGY